MSEESELAASAAADGASPPGEEAAAPRAGASVISDEEVAALLEKKTGRNVQPYDLGKERVSRMRLPTLEMLCRSFAARCAGSIGTLLAREIGFEFAGLSNIKVHQVLANLPAPAALAVLRFKPLPDTALLHVDENLLLGLMEAFFGGQSRGVNAPSGIAATAAQRFLGVLVRHMAPAWSAAWGPVANLEVELVKAEPNPRFVQIGGPQELLTTAKFQVNLGELGGSVEFLLTDTLMAPVRDALAADSAASNAVPQAAWAPVLAAGLAQAKIETRAILAQTKISIGELVKLSPGDVIPIEAPDQVILLAGDVPLYRGRFGVSGGYNALRVISGVSHER